MPMIIDASQIICYYSSISKQESWQFGNNVYIVDGKALLVWNGTELKKASEIAKIPVVTIAKSPSGGGTSYEDLNLLQSGFTELFLGRCTVSELIITDCRLA